jgi:hypothetical protein
MPAVAEVICQSCDRTQTLAIPVVARPHILPLCACGGRLQVVRAFSDRRRFERSVDVERRLDRFRYPLRGGPRTV